MTKETTHKFTVISNKSITNEDISASVTNSNGIHYQSNPMYEKLLNFQELQKKKRFTVEDLLKW